MLFLTLVNLFNYLDRYLLPAVLPLIIAEFSLSNAQAGRLVSAFVFGYFICSPVFGWLGDRCARPRLMMVGVALWSLATMGSALAGSFLVLLLARAAVGVGEASFGTVAPGYIKDRIQDPLRVNRAFSIFFSAIPAGSALAFLVAGVLVSYFSWRNVFIICGIPGLILALLLGRFREVRVARDEPSVPLLRSLSLIMSRPVLWFAIGGYVLNSFALNGIAAFVTQYGVQLGFELDEVSRLFGVMLVVTGFAGTLGGGWLAEKLAARGTNRPQRLLLFVGLTALIGVPFAVIAFATQNHYLFLGFCFVAELLIFAGVAPVNAVIVVSCPAQLVTLTQGVTIFALNLLGALPAPVIIGYVADEISLSTGMQMAAIALGLSAVIWLAGSHPRWHRASV